MKELPARSGIALRLHKENALVVINICGKQVVDTWALAAGDAAHRYLSASHTCMQNGRLFVVTGDDLYDTMREPILRLEGGTYSGPHDLLIPSCDANRYRQLGVESGHDNCCDNFHNAIAAAGLEWPAVVPQPLNLFMNVPIDEKGALSISEPVAVPSDTVVLRALQEVIVVLSACPQDLAATNGSGRTPTKIGYEIHH